MRRVGVLLWLMAVCVAIPAQAAHPLTGAAPYLEVRYTLLGNIPSLIGSVECPCIGSEVIAGFLAHPFNVPRWSLDVSAGQNFQTRWDDPESYRFLVKSDVEIGENLTWLLSYEERHNFDRASHVPTEYVDYRGLHTRTQGNLLWAISGLRYAYTGVRWSFR
jgi:hypothetical protein